MTVICPGPAAPQTAHDPDVSTCPECAETDTPATYECWGCGETFTFRALADVDWEGLPCPNRCGNVLSPA